MGVVKSGGNIMLKVECYTYTFHNTYPTIFNINQGRLLITKDPPSTFTWVGTPDHCWSRRTHHPC